MDKDKIPQDSETESPEKSPVDLSALQDFDFGTSWSESKTKTSDSRSSDRSFRQGDRRHGENKPDRKDRRPFKPGTFHKSPRPEGGDRGESPQYQGAGKGRPRFERPEAPKKVIEVSFYPEDAGFNAICKALKTSTITYELFDIARTILDKEERFYVVIRPEESTAGGAETFLYVVESDGLPYLTEDSAKQQALTNCLEHFFTTETVEVEPPSGSFSSIRKCGITGELLGPPNFHKIQKIMAHHHAARLSNMAYARFESRIESVTDEESIAQWLEKMKTQTTYTLKPQFGEPRVFEDGESARAYANANLTDKMVSKHTSVKLAGTQMSKVKDELIRANLEFAWERQKRFPLDSANLLRGRLRRQKFSLYKKGSKGVSYVCAVKRRFRDPSEVFAEPVQKLLEFLENNPGTPAKHLPEKYLGIVKSVEEGETVPEMTPDQQAILKAMSLDFQWLLKEGYIAEYADGKVYANPQAGSGQGVENPKVKKASAKEKPDSPSAPLADSSADNSSDTPIVAEETEVEAPAVSVEAVVETEVSIPEDSGVENGANATTEELASAVVPASETVEVAAIEKQEPVDAQGTSEPAASEKIKETPETVAENPETVAENPAPLAAEEVKESEGKEGDEEVKEPAKS